MVFFSWYPQEIHSCHHDHCLLFINVQTYNITYVFYAWQDEIKMECKFAANRYIFMNEQAA